jgi:hypothetical protein
MGIVSKTATERSREGHVQTFGDDQGHINAACCECPKCLHRRFDAKLLSGSLQIGVDLAEGGDRYTVHSVRFK